mmetsp:Transcript_36941/g.73723  ORF Transcript_36941/g.73723 Transcript_36941/m.73723 type:complete len:90 (-) Transcript_36941:111-380(-)
MLYRHAFMWWLIVFGSGLVFFMPRYQFGSQVCPQALKRQMLQEAHAASLRCHLWLVLRMVATLHPYRVMRLGEGSITTMECNTVQQGRN